jgi:hypothetical protein
MKLHMKVIESHGQAVAEQLPLPYAEEWSFRPREKRQSCKNFDYSAD